MSMFRLACVAAVLLVLIVGNAPANAAAKKIQTVEGITEYRLDNGLQILLYPDPSKPTVTINLTVLVGSRHEGYGETGMAHLLEHMVFKGTPSHTLIPKALQDRGARFNGTTWVDRTNYFETMPASDDNLEFGIALEADRMVNSFIKAEDLASEMTVVRNEFERGENSPRNLLYQRILSAAYEWHNYGKSTIGNRSDIERVPVANLREFYVRFYQPDNAMLVIAGKFDEAKALSFAEKYFGSIPRPERKLNQTYTEEPPQDGERNVLLRRVGDVALVGAAYHIPAGSHPDIAALDVLSEILGAAPSGRLYKALVESGKAANVFADANSWHDPGIFEVGAEVPRDQPLDAVRDLMLEVTEKTGSTEISSQEVERARQKILKDREIAAADTSRIAVQLSNWASQGDWRLYFLHRDRVEKVTPADVQRVAAAYLRQNNRTVGMFLPTEKADLVGIPQSDDIAKQLAGYQGRKETAQGEAFDVSPANIEARVRRTTLTEGLKAVYLPKKTRGEAVWVRITLRYGNLENLKGQTTAAGFLPHLMLNGTQKLSRQQIQDELDTHRTTLTAAGDTGVATFSLQTKRGDLAAMLALVKQILREPSLPQDEFDVLHVQQMSALEQQLKDPQPLAATAVRRAVSPYASDDPRYIPSLPEEVDRVKGLTLPQVKKLYDDYLGSLAGEVTVVGDFDPEPTGAALQSIFAGWTTKQAYARIPRLAFPQVKGRKIDINTPDKANAVYMAGLTFGLKDSDPDYPALVIGNFIFGGGSLASRLGDRVRQKEGLAYGVGSFVSVDALDSRASLSIFASYNPQNVTKVESAIREELARLLTDGVAAEELQRAKQAYLQQQQVQRTNDAALTALLDDTAYTNRTMEFYADLDKKITALKPDDIPSVLKKYIDPARLTIAIAGDFAATKK